MQGGVSWFILSKVEWKAMLWGGLYALLAFLVLLICPGSYFLLPYSLLTLPSPLVLLSMALSDFSSIVLLMRIPSLPVLCGMLGGSLISWRLRRQATRHPLTGRDGWRAGAAVGAWFGISLGVLFLIAPSGHTPRIVETMTRLSGWGIRQYVNALINALFVISVLTMFITAVGGLLGRLLYAREDAARAQEPSEEERGQIGLRPGCIGLLALAFLIMYLYGDVSRLLAKIPPFPSRFMTTGDFGIVSQKPCGAPCFQGIMPGVTTIKDAYLSLLKVGAPCRVYARRFEVAAPIDEEGIRCYRGATQIRIHSSIGGPGQQHETDEAKVVVDSIELRPPTNVTVAQLLARYGPPDSVRAGSGGTQSRVWFFYDKLHTYIEFPIQEQAGFVLSADTAIETAYYFTATGYQEASDLWNSRQPWKGYGMYP